MVVCLCHANRSWKLKDKWQNLRVKYALVCTFQLALHHLHIIFSTLLFKLALFFFDKHLAHFFLRRILFQYTFCFEQLFFHG